MDKSAKTDSYTGLRASRSFQAQAQTHPSVHAPVASYQDSSHLAMTTMTMSSAPGVVNLPICLPGLEVLIGIDQLFVHQAVNIRELFSNVRNDFEVLTSSGQRLFHVIELTGTVARNLGGGHQNFEMSFVDAAGRELLRVEGSPGFYAGGLGSVGIVYQSTDGSRQKLGDVVQEKSGCTLEYLIRDAFGNGIYKIRGPQYGDCCCGLFMTGSVAFTLLTMDEKTIVGGIGKLWGGVLREVFTMADNYGLSFPADLDVTTKAILLGACIMFDFQFFERH